MIKTIKVKRQMHIWELLEYVRKNELRGRYFRVMGESRYIKVTLDGDIYFDADFADFCFRPDDTFTVEVEEEITEDTVFRWIVEVNEERLWTQMDGSINDVKDNMSKSIYALIDGKLELIWEAENDEQ